MAVKNNLTIVSCSAVLPFVCQLRGQLSLLYFLNVLLKMHVANLPALTYLLARNKEFIKRVRIIKNNILSILQYTLF
jgi:hypothetical protein